MGLYPRNLNEYVVAMGIPRGPDSKVYLVDTEQGDDSFPGTTFEKPMASVEAAEDKCVTKQHDTVILLARDTADNPTAAIAWDKDFTHLIGMGCEHFGVGQRSRIVGTAAKDLSQVITFSGNGCMVKNIQIYNGNDAAADSGAAIVSGSRNKFENVLFAGMAHLTAAARAGSYSLSLTGSENEFIRTSIGLQTIIRAAANTELLISGANAYRNKFILSELLSWSVTAGKLLAKFSADSVPWTTQFENCLFGNLNMTAGGASGSKIDNAISDLSTAFHQIIMRGDNPVVGCTGVADTVDHIWSAAPVPAAGFGLAVNPTT